MNQRGNSVPGYDGRRVKRRGRRLAVVLALWALTDLPVGDAQVSLPQVQVPNLPVQLPVDVKKTVSGVSGELDPRKLENVRTIRVQNLIARHRDVVEPDPQGAPTIRSEVLAFSPTDQALEGARGAGFSIKREQVLEGLEARIVVLQAPEGMSTKRALKTLRKLDPEGTYDYNHLYTESGETAEPSPQPPPVNGRGNEEASPPASPASGRAGETLRIGLIDTGVDTTHPVFRDALVHTHGCAGDPVPDAHGTAVASLIVGQAGKFHGAAPGAELYSVDVFCGIETGGTADLIAAAFAWLARERVPIINVSLVGPRNLMIESAVRILVGRGVIIVAAVGNDGPAAPPLFPASYDGVVGVTGVDAKQRVIAEACRGPQVDFAAPGADMAVAIPAQKYSQGRGTSFAAPIVTGLLAAQLQSEKGNGQTAIADLAKEAVDLGAHGRDRTYGDGLVGGALRIDLAAVLPIEKGQN